MTNKARAEAFEEWATTHFSPEALAFDKALEREHDDLSAIAFWAGCEHGVSEVEEKYKAVVEALKAFGTCTTGRCPYCGEYFSSGYGVRHEGAFHDAFCPFARKDAALMALEMSSEMSPSTEPEKRGEMSIDMTGVEGEG